ncbi:CAAX prenyl protease [Malassezia equina]|uniref:intramembrane prenyl-peptidase Rce1 n=1 Tax=Malassezia equina TaxID=1381935 RepID=A0AAF0EKY5_9BASI|nr:CAAX prenyl protease [Malassezia equina]
MAGVYVGTLHALPQVVALVRTGQWAPARPRDDPRTIRSRLGCASLATLVNMTWTCRILAQQGFLSKRQPFRFLDALAWLGLPMPRLSFLVSHWLPFHPSLCATFLEGLRIVGQSALLTSFLYLGTFWADLRANALPGQAGYYDEKGPRPGLLFWRNYVIPARAWKGALVQTALQFAYTTVFGWYATFLFQRTGTVWAPLVAHILCNFMGLPRLAPRSSTLAHIVDVAMHVVGISTFIVAELLLSLVNVLLGLLAKALAVALALTKVADLVLGLLSVLLGLLAEVRAVLLSLLTEVAGLVLGLVEGVLSRAP